MPWMTPGALDRERIRWRRWKPNHGGWNQPLWIRLQAAWQRAMKERTP